ncbi:MAG: succinate dehydrogenase, cytochrome b556 subunit [Methylomonas sp.]|jgi:succinate dehydrogenase / fumarate reductase cytochrome b subunit
MTSDRRPLSPHLQVYRLPLTGLFSITHRITGVLLSFGLVLFAAILISIAGGAQSYAAMQNFMSLGVCRLIYWGFLFALFFHLCHGVRHLLWDIGETFDRATLDRYALYELGAAALLFLLALIIS